jgi:hypothetical protein
MSDNRKKSINGKTLEEFFESKTGLKKIAQKDKPSFQNSLGENQIIDFDFKTNINGTDVLIDLTTTFRADRIKQKAYNALMYKTHINENVMFYVGVGSLLENGKVKKTTLIEGIDSIILVDELIDLVNKPKNVLMV